MNATTTRLLTRAAALCMPVFLGACAATGENQSAGQRVADGTRVELNQPLRFPGRSARAYVQFGETLRRNDVNEWAPYCSFGLNRNRDGAPLVREVGPTTFTVSDSRSGVDVSLVPDDAGPAGLIRDRGIMVAGQFGGGRGGTPALHIYYTTMSLYSEQQPQVDDLTCAYRGSLPDRNLTVEEIRDTLGDIARLY
ncbi:MAG: hypothetical protein U5R46_05470 [Gammaproteobacteria bacterium]|nr:hypothetical protein [Gammaproteobacteria bacterium]